MPEKWLRTKEKLHLAFQMDIQEYINSGILYEYCMNSLSDAEKEGVETMCALYPRVQEELSQIKRSLETHSDNNTIKPGKALQESIWNVLDNINKEKKGNLQDLPLINKYSDHENWKRIVIPFMPGEITSGTSIKTIRKNDRVTQMLVVSTCDIPDETHTGEQESFIILEGECECYVGDTIVRLAPGGFLEIPLHTHHNVKVLSPYVVAVLQHVAI